MPVKRISIGRPTRASEAAERFNIIRSESLNKDVSKNLKDPPFKGVHIEGSGATPKHEVINFVKVDVETLVASANRMTAAERKELLARLSLSESGINGQERDIDMWSGAVYEALLRLAGQGDGASLGPLVIKRLVTAPNAWSPINAFMKASKLDRLTVTERQSVYQLLARLLVQHAKQLADHKGIVFSAKLVVTCGTSIAQVFDRAFPNYVASGIAHIVARRLTAPRIVVH